MFSGTYKYAPILVLINYPFVFILGPLYYFYIQVLLHKNYTFKIYNLLHFSPLLYGFYILKWFFPLSHNKKIEALTWAWFSEREIKPIVWLEYSIPNLITITYLIISLFFILKTTKKIKLNFFKYRY